MKNNRVLILCACCIFLFFSCEDKNQIDGLIIEPSQDEYVDSNLNPSGGYDLGHIGNLYFDLSGDQSYSQKFWKFNRFHLTGGTHNGPDSGGELDLLTLNTYNDSYYVPPEAFDAPCVILDEPVFTNEIDCINQGGIWEGSDIVYVYDSETSTYSPYTEEYQVLSDLTTEQGVDSSVVSIESSLDLKTPASSSDDPLEKMEWSIGENMYSFSTISQIKDTLTIDYSYSYLSEMNFVPLDTILNPILDDVVVIIDDEEVSDEVRNYDIFDTLYVDSQDPLPVLVSREHIFYSYRNELNHNFGQRETTDCNDNYRKDPAELKMDDFESSCSGNWVLDDQDACDSYCDDDPSLTMHDMCWNSAVNDLRLTAHCIENSTLNAFCDYGNNLRDGIEVLYDACQGDCDGENGYIDVIGQGVEPFEDRNCNGFYDQVLEEEITSANNENDCLFLYGSWDDDSNLCFLDSGNGQWDDMETCYGDLESCGYMGLYKKGIAPNYLLASYLDQNNPSALTSVYAGDVYKDCGIDGECNEEEDDFNLGYCVDGFSGSEELCCKYNKCWNYNSQSCDFNLAGCAYPDGDTWSENLDPSEDDSPAGGERNFQYDLGEIIVKDFDGNGQYSSATQLVTKFLNYEGCVEGQPDCGGDVFDIISDDFEMATASTEIQKEKSKVEVSSYSIVGQLPIDINDLNELNIIKTEWPDSDESDGKSEDYMLFMNSDNQDQVGMHYIIKMIQPYYYYANTPYSGAFDNIADQWWQEISWEQDTLMYSLDGSIIDGQTFYSSYSVESDTANYIIHKEYEVSSAVAEMVYSPTVEDCILITRTITTTMLGPAIDFKIKSETYLKEGYPIVREDVYWSWPPIFEGERVFEPVSRIEYCETCDRENNYPGNSLFNRIESINPGEFENSNAFDFEPFKLSNTMGLQRVVVPD